MEREFLQYPEKKNESDKAALYRQGTQHQHNKRIES